MVALCASVTANGARHGGIPYGEILKTAASMDKEVGRDRETVDEL
jgi:hypothetical protein